MDNERAKQNPVISSHEMDLIREKCPGYIYALGMLSTARKVHKTYAEVLKQIEDDPYNQEHISSYIIACEFLSSNLPQDTVIDLKVG